MTIEKYYEVLKKYAPTQGLILNPDWEVVSPLLQGLLTNGARYGYRTCPCRPATGVLEKDRDIVCPCAYAKADIAEFGACYCWLYVSQAWIENQIPRRQIPERRPPEKIWDL
ncbi:ferredoxin:thioredoxin reductase [candidate division KSB1 bacterium]|nr:ferredoxin:thioredoxin reductase [candidate division KSB1 bacterium]